ncbi:C-type lectin domain family 4 member C [Fundulus heteroclitus]|uniref:C-type lectin domain family 4 member C n=1 Tax=Fundulus heteroclitus TaxID=8078 RepID=UPI00165A37C6|nr:C-type lectin domain family 4 member C [Fundulus heteroclitus]
MENIYVSVEPFKPLPKPPAPVKIPEASENSKNSFYLGVIIFLVLLNVLQAGRIVFGIYAYQSGNLAADLSAKLSSMTVERDQLNANLTDMAEELTRLRQMQACPAQWTTFGDSCYFVSGCGSWDEGREDCKKKNAHLVVINNAEEQAFVTNYTEKFILDWFERQRTHGLGSLTADLSDIKDNLTDHLQASNDQLILMTKQRDLMKSNLTETSEELIRLQNLSKQKKTCPAGWRMSSSSCYLLSTNTGSWDKGREDCRNRGGDLVVIDNAEEQRFISTFTNKYTWIGLNDKETEGSWKWVDGTSLTLT